MKRAVIFINGNRPKKDRVLPFVRKSDTVICADGGAAHALFCGLIPDIVIGDLDSLSPSLKKKLEKQSTKWITHPRTKDKTDSELAIEYAVANGYSDIILFGVVGDRLDHVLGSLLFLTYHTEGRTLRIIEEKQEIHVVNDATLNLRGKKGDFISLLPMTSKTKVTTKNLLYPLYGDTLPYGKTLGISNELTKNNAVVFVEKGILLVIHTPA